MKNLKTAIPSGAWDEKLMELYEDESLLSYQKERYVALLDKFQEAYGDREVAIISAPGRSEVCGNHTDHQHGQVVAASIHLDALGVVAPNSDLKIRLISEGYAEIVVDLTRLKKEKSDEGTTSGLIKGVAAGLKDRGYAIGGFDCVLTSDVLIGAGLSSSAAFEIFLGTTLSHLYNAGQVLPVELATIGQYAENVYFGKPCGLMDQMACSVGGMIHIDFKDVAHPLVEQIPVDFRKFGMSLCITDTKGSHADLTEDYAAVPREMKQVAAHYGKSYLREVEEADFYREIGKLASIMGDRAVLRGMHFYAEEHRVEALVKALHEGNKEEFLKNITASGNSSFKYLQNVYTVRDVAHQSVSLALAVSEQALGGEGATRVHGGGFAGTIQAFVPGEKVEAYRSAMDAVFGEGACHVLKVRRFGGTRVI
ncbi:MAG: galactokinase [Lachnospiraceae bacterium]|nr:galactokinase [Lachnospiraceae bacterium]